MDIFGRFGGRVSDSPAPYPTPRVQIGCRVNLSPQHPKRRKCSLIIRHLQALGVGGVEGAGQPVCIGTIYARALRAHARETPTRHNESPAHSPACRHISSPGCRSHTSPCLCAAVGRCSHLKIHASCSLSFAISLCTYWWALKNSFSSTLK